MCCATGEKKVFTVKLSVGCVVAITGFCLYSHFKMSGQQQQLRPNRAMSSTVEEGKPLIGHKADAKA